uniref:Uncharacterized protein n=1 Tax=Rhizophora mucronata TaxID=61149 RepID=A0A2P2QNQ8_RHIMU
MSSFNSLIFQCSLNRFGPLSFKQNSNLAIINLLIYMRHGLSKEEKRITKLIDINSPTSIS